MEYVRPATDFWVIGINYRKSDTALRGRYAINEEQYEHILSTASVFGVSSLFILSTCNRTEIYGQTQEAYNLIRLLCSQTEGDITCFVSQAYQKKNDDALNHIFRVATGLDSQILGDYEIVGQMKQAFHFARSRGYSNSFLDRLFNTVLQCSRAVRTETRLSSGTVSVAFAAVQFLTTRMSISGAKILILGSGEIGRNTCRNLVATMEGPPQITLMNRTREKVQAFAEEMNLDTAPIEQLQQYVDHCDIIIVATAATRPLLSVHHFKGQDTKMLIDLSVPNNIDPSVRAHKGITLANVDDLSLINDETLRLRQAEIPAVKALINIYIHEFSEWYTMQQHVPVLKAVKEKLKTLNRQFSAARTEPGKDDVQKAINKMALKMRTEETRPGCNYIETIYHYLSEKSV